MEPANWQRIEELFHAALELGPDERAVFLDGACRDETERREVESLIAHDEQHERFIDSPPVELAAELLTAEPSRLAIGVRVDRYQIVAPLGRGGMGEVYLAVDLRLDRRVALKLLPSEFGDDDERLRRFEREARTASSLNHPNILTIHEIGEAASEISGSRYIVAEYVEGETVRERASRGPLAPSDALDIARQVASALETAHAAGIVHRDIKPENVIVRPDGLVKVLDFGLAKLAERPAASFDRQTGPDAVASLLRTRPGAVMGTISYMSPEQARGLDVDRRTDLFSLGVMLYELVAGHRPFDGATASEVRAAILDHEPAPLRTVAPRASEELERIVGRLLAKERSDRYQSASDLRADLARVRDDLDEPADEPAVSADSAPKPRFGARALLVAVTIAVALSAIAATAYRSLRRAPSAKLESLAVLPLKSIGAEADTDYLGLGIADTIITRVSRIGGVTVRPTSAVRRFVDPNLDSLEAGRQLKVDAVVDGFVQRAGDRLRVSVSLVRVEDAALLWSETFDLAASNIFKVQDEVSRQVASRLSVELTTSDEARLARRETSNPEAYDYYAKAAYHFSNRDWMDRTRAESDQTIELLKRAIELDPGYALAHARLGYAYAWTAIIYETNAHSRIEEARHETDVAETLDPQLADVHVARAFIHWSYYGGWRVDAAVRELRLAQQLDPNVGHFELADIYAHIGLDEENEREIETALALNPTGDFLKRNQVYMYFLRAMPDEALAANRRHFDLGPTATYFIEKRRPDEAEPLVDAEARRGGDEVWTADQRLMLMTLRGRHREAIDALPHLLGLASERQPRGYHHATYTAARVFAQAGRRAEALRWLRACADDGFPNYTLFLRDPFLDPIRDDPEFVRFMAEMRERRDRYRREFG